MDTIQSLTQCLNCKMDIEIEQRWEPGGVNDYGGYFLECTECQHVFEHRLGRDIAESFVRSGARVLDVYDDESGDKQRKLEQHGIA